MTVHQRYIARTILSLIAIAAAFLGIEFGYRAYLTYKFSHAAFPASFVPSFFAIDGVRERTPDDGIYFPRLDIPYRHFSATHVLLFHSRIRTNNLGYRAERDWTRAKPAGELRVAVLGDSLTASVMSDYSWTDVAERALNADKALLADLGVARVAVLNFGVVGAGFDTMAQVEADHARRFAPDLTVVNFITPDILRPALSIDPVGPAEPAPRLYFATVDISTDAAKAETVVECDTPTTGLGVPGCRPSTLIRADDAQVFDAEAMRGVKLLLSRHFLWGGLWRSTYPYSIEAVLGEPFRLRERGFFDIFDLIVAKARAAESSDESVRRSSATIARLKARVDSLLFVHAPTITEILERATRPALVEKLRHASNIEVRFMGESAQLQGALANEVESWFNVPYDTHFSTNGVEVYGNAFAELIATELRTQKRRQ